MCGLYMLKKNQHRPTEDYCFVFSIWRQNEVMLVGVNKQPILPECVIFMWVYLLNYGKMDPTPPSSQI